MDGARDQYEERLKEVFESFDGSGLGSLSPEELTDLCRALQLEENTLNTLLHTLLQDQISARVRDHMHTHVILFYFSLNFCVICFFYCCNFNAETLNVQENLSVVYISETILYKTQTK